MRAPNFSFTHHVGVAHVLHGPVSHGGSSSRRARSAAPARRTPRSRRPRARRTAAPHDAAAAEQLAAALRAGVGHLRLELLEPPARRAATETECDPVAEDLPTLLPQPVRRFRHVLTLAVVALLAVAVYIVVRDLIRGYWTTRGARGRALHAAQPLRAPRPARDPRRAGEARQLDARPAPRPQRRARPSMLSQPFFDALPRPRLARAGRPPPRRRRPQLLAQPRRRQVGVDGRCARSSRGTAASRSAGSRWAATARSSSAPERSLLRGRRPLAGALVQRRRQRRRARSTTPRTTRATTSSTTRRTTRRRSGSTSALRIRSTTRPSTTRTRSTRSCTSGRAGTTAATGTRTCAQYLAFYARHCA